MIEYGIVYYEGPGPVRRPGPADRRCGGLPGLVIVIVLLIVIVIVMPIEDVVDFQDLHVAYYGCY